MVGVGLHALKVDLAAGGGRGEDAAASVVGATFAVSAFGSGAAAASCWVAGSLDTPQRSPHQIAHGVEVTLRGRDDPLDPAPLVE